MLLESLFDDARDSVEDKHGPIGRANCNIFATTTKSGSVPVAAYMEFVVTRKEIEIFNTNHMSREKGSQEKK